ncbi:MAG: hypothetical protein KC445_20590 [Anaerolineales bacterium]|nr:hypothetical protein [Anaerolineales bacterium]
MMYHLKFRLQVENTMDTDSAAELPEALRPIASLISKSQKAQQKLAPGTWQFVMLQENLEALHLALALLQNDVKKLENVTKLDVQNALRAVGSMIEKTEKAQPKFAAGTSQHTLLQNRLKALQIAKRRLAAFQTQTAQPKNETA